MRRENRNNSPTSIAFGIHHAGASNSLIEEIEDL